MKLAIIGGREFNDYDLLFKTIDKYYSECNFSSGPGIGGAEPPNYKITEVISGGARGADSLGEKWAKIYNIKTTIFLPDWDKYGRQAGFLRNRDIIEAADEVLCFWDGISRGSANSLGIAKKLKKTTIIVYF